MAYRELGMVELREIVRRWQGGEGVRALARGTGMDRKTIAAYLRAAQAAGVQPGSGPPTDEQLTDIVATRRPGRPSNTDAPSPEFEVLRPCQRPPKESHSGSPMLSQAGDAAGLRASR